MDASVEALDGEIVQKFKKLPLDYEENKICVSVPQNFIYACSDTVGEVYCSNRGKVVIDLSIGEVPEPTETWNDILLDIDGKIWMHYAVSDPDPGVVDETQGTMVVTLTTSIK